MELPKGAKKLPERLWDTKRAPDIMAVGSYACEGCGHAFRLEKGSTPVRAMCHCGTVYELVAE